MVGRGCRSLWHQTLFVFVFNLVQTLKYGTLNIDFSWVFSFWPVFDVFFVGIQEGFSGCSCLPNRTISTTNVILQASLQRNCTRSLVEFFGSGTSPYQLVLRILIRSVGKIRRNTQIHCDKKTNIGCFFKKTSDVFQQDSAKIMVRPSWDDNAMAAMLFYQLFGDMVQRRHPPTGWTYHAFFQQDFRLRAGNFYDLDLYIIHITILTYIYIDINTYTNKCMYIKCKHNFFKTYIEFIQDDPGIFPNFFPKGPFTLSQRNSMGHSPFFFSWKLSTKKILTPCEKSSFEDSLKEILQIHINSPPDWLTTLIFHRAEDRSLHCR